MTNSSLDLIFVVIFLYLNNQDKFEKDALDDDIEKKPDDHSSLDNKKDAIDDTEKFIPGEEFVFILDSEPMPSPSKWSPHIFCFERDIWEE